MCSGTVRLRRFVAFALTLIVVSAQAGCVVIPTSTSGTFEEQTVVTDGLVGMSVEEIRSQLGSPSHSFDAPGASYLVYRRDAEEKWLSLAHPVAMLWFQLPVQWGSARLIQCLMMEIREDEVIRADIKSIGHKLESAMHMPETHHKRDICLSLFWDENEFKLIESLARHYRRDRLIAQAETPSLQMAIDLATEFQETSYLRDFAMAGNDEAAEMMGFRFQDLEPLKKLAAEGNRRSIFYLAHRFRELAPLRELALAGDFEASATLARSHDDKSALYNLAQKGNLEAAVMLAETYNDRGPLTALASQGDPEAARALKTIPCLRFYYKTDDAAGEQFSDEYIRVCRPEEVPENETEPVFGDWGPSEGIGYRTYFKSASSASRYAARCEQAVECIAR